MSIISSDVRAIATERLATLGLSVVYGGHVDESNELGTSSAASRTSDLHAALHDPNVAGILTAIGGYSCNQLLEHIDFRAIAERPKLLCGYSDITVLQNAILAKTGIVTYSGPHFSSFGMKLGFEYAADSFVQCTMQNAAYALRPSDQWSDDEWWLSQDDRSFASNTLKHHVLQAGAAESLLVGGNLTSFILLCGTEWFPDLAGKIILLEDDGAGGRDTAAIFDRQVQALAHQPGFDSVAGVLIGRFPQAANVSMEQLAEIVLPRIGSKAIPVIANLDVGHTTPIATLPIGGTLRISSERSNARIEVLEH